MTLTQQLTPFTCGLACIESLATDLGKPISQTEMLIRFKGLLLSTISQHEIFGATNILVMARILQELGFKPFVGKDHRKDIMVQEFKKNPNCIITANVQLKANHALRLVSVPNDDSLELMDPGFFQIGASNAVFTIDDLIQWDYSFIILQ